MQAVKNQLKKFIHNGGIPVMEWHLNNGDYFTVDISVNDNGVVFEFDDMGLPNYFSGDVDCTDGGACLIKHDEAITDLDYYLQEIHDEIIEGFLIPHNLY